jgi:hypothetical protein
MSAFRQPFYLRLGAASCALVIGGWLGLGCDELVCGPGTIERDRTCAPADAVGDGTRCGPGTSLDPVTLECRADTSCGPETVAQLDPATGAITCVSISGACAAPIPCPAPAAASQTSFCGVLVDVETGARVAQPDATGAPCRPDQAQLSGPCALQVSFYDPAALFADSAGAAPLPAGGVTVDDCGRFAGVDIERGSAVELAVVTEDLPGVIAAIVKRTAVIATVVGAASTAAVRAYVTRTATDDRWTASAAVPASFVDAGALLAVFVYASGVDASGTPAADVEITVAGVAATGDYYFADAFATSRAALDPEQAATGVNGSGLLLDSPALLPHSGSGGEPAGCVWPNVPAKTTPGLLLVRQLVAQCP